MFKGKRGRLRLLAIGLAIFMMWATSTWWEQQVALQEQQAELEELESEAEEIRQYQLELNQQITRLHDLDYIAEIARKEYFLSKDGEMIFNVSD